MIYENAEMKNPCLMSAREAAAAIAEKKLSSVELIEACLQRIESREYAVGAWAHIDKDIVIAEAKARDRQDSLGPLHGVPVGIKDVIDTIDMPTEYGSAIYKGHRPRREAACVSLVPRAGGVILGNRVCSLSSWENEKSTQPDAYARWFFERLCCCCS